MLGEDDTLRRLEQAAEKPVQIEPLDDHLLVQLAEEDHETRTGIVIPASSEVAVRSAIVIAVGEEVTGVAPGDKVLFPAAAAIDVRVAGERVTLLRRCDLIARFGE